MCRSLYLFLSHTFIYLWSLAHVCTSGYNASNSTAYPSIVRKDGKGHNGDIVLKTGRQCQTDVGMADLGEIISIGSSNQDCILDIDDIGRWEWVFPLDAGKQGLSVVEDYRRYCTNTCSSVYVHVWRNCGHAQWCYNNCVTQTHTSLSSIVLTFYNCSFHKVRMLLIAHRVLKCHKLSRKL